MELIELYMNPGKEPLKIDDLEKLVLVSDPKISPDTKYTLFTVTKPSFKEDKYLSNIWILDNETMEYEQLTMGNFDNSPEWSPDSKHVSFISRRTFKEEEIGAEIWIFNISKRYEPRLLVKQDKPIFNTRWNPKIKTMMFISPVGRIDEDVKVIEDIPIWFNGKGFTYNIRNHIFLVDVSSGNIEQITEGDSDIKYAEWSNDGNRIAYISSDDKLKPYISDIHILDLNTGENIILTSRDMYITDLCWSPDDDHIAFRGHDLKWGLTTHSKIWVIDIVNIEIKLLTKLDRDLVNAMNSDVRGPSSIRRIQWIEENIFFPIAEGGTVWLSKINLDHNMEYVVRGDFTVEDYAISKDYIILTLMNSIHPPELYIHKDGETTKITNFNDYILDRVTLNKHEKFSFTASDGVKIEGWILKPYGFKDGQKYPTVFIFMVAHLQPMGKASYMNFTYCQERDIL